MTRSIQIHEHVTEYIQLDIIKHIIYNLYIEMLKVNQRIVSGIVI